MKKMLLAIAAMVAAATTALAATPCSGARPNSRRKCPRAAVQGHFPESENVRAMVQECFSVRKSLRAMRFPSQIEAGSGILERKLMLCREFDKAK